MPDIKTLVLYIFIGKYKNYPRQCSYGIMVHALSKMTTLDGDIDPVLFNKLGYVDHNDYRNTYPGKFEKEEGSINTNIVNEAGLDKLQNGKSGLDTNVNRVFETMSVTSLVLQKILCSDVLFVVPTINDISKISGSEDMKHKDFWFCSDWKEE